MFSHAQRRATGGGGGGGGGAGQRGLPRSFWKCSDFGKKDPDCLLLWVNYSIQNVVLKVSSRKMSKMFPCGASFSFAFGQMFIEVS